MSAVNEIIFNSISDKEALGKLAEHIMKILCASTLIIDTEGNIVSSAAIEDKPRFNTADIKKANTFKSTDIYETWGDY